MSKNPFSDETKNDMASGKPTNVEPVMPPGEGQAADGQATNGQTAGKPIFNRWFVVLGALIIQLCLGSIYAYGAFAKPIMADLETSLLQTQLPFAIGLLSFALTMVFAGKWQDKIGPQKVALTGGVVLGIGIMLSSLASNIETLYFTYGAIGGAGIGFAYVCPIAALVKWFPDKKGLIAGIAVAGFGAGAFVFAQLATSVMIADVSSDETGFLKDGLDDMDDEDALFLGDYTDLAALEIYLLTTDYNDSAALELNGTDVTADMLKESEVGEADLSDSELELIANDDPSQLTDREKDKREDAYKTAREHLLATGKNDIYDDFDWNAAFLWLGIIFLIGVVLGSFLLVNPPEGWLPGGWTPPVQTTDTGEVVKSDYEWREMIKTPTFWLLWGMFLLAATSGLMTIGNIGKFAADVNIGAAEIAMAIGFLSIFNGAGRIAWGAISDIIGRTKTLFFMYVLQAITMFMLYELGKSGSGGLIIGASLVGFCFGGNFAMFPSATADFFGTRKVGQNYGFVFTAYGIAGILGALIAGLLYEATGNYAIIFSLMAFFSLIAAFLSFITRAPHEKSGLSVLKKAS